MSHWTAEQSETVRKLWDSGMAASRIAATMGGAFTRNMIIGRVHRMGLPGRATTDNKHGRPGNQKTGNYGKPRQKAAQGASRPAPRIVSLKHAEASPEPAQPHVEPVAVAIPISRRVTIVELGLGDCRWPLGDPLAPEFRYCGTKCDPAKPYCVAHHRMAFQPSTPNPRKYFVTNHAPERAA